MPGVYEHTQLPTTHFPPIVPMLEGCDDVQHSMMLSLHHQCMSSRGFAHCIKMYAIIIWGSFFLRHNSTGVWDQTWIKG